MQLLPRRSSTLRWAAALCAAALVAAGVSLGAVEAGGAAPLGGSTPAAGQESPEGGSAPAAGEPAGHHAGSGASHRATGGGGTASVACAGSLLRLYYGTLGPAFRRATGDGFGGPPCAGSLALSEEILSREISPGVFMSIGSKAIKELFPAHRASFSLAVASDPLVLAFSRHSRYYRELEAIKHHQKPLSYLFKLLATPGFRLGRTDPTQDPQGAFFVLMTKLAGRVLHLPAGEAARALGITATSPFGSRSQIYSEDALPTDISTGIVDAGSEYLPEARQYGLDYLSLPPALDFASPSEIGLYSSVTLKVAGSIVRGEVIYLNVALVNAPKGTRLHHNDAAADQAFVAFLLGRDARASLGKVGYKLNRPVVDLAPGETARRALPPAALRLFRALRGTTSPA